MSYGGQKAATNDLHLATGNERHTTFAWPCQVLRRNSMRGEMWSSAVLS